MSCTIVSGTSSSITLNKLDQEETTDPKYSLIFSGSVPEEATRARFTYKGSVYDIRIKCSEGEAEGELEFSELPVGWSEILGCNQTIDTTVTFYNCTQDACCAGFDDVTTMSELSEEEATSSFEYGIGSQDYLVPNLIETQS